MRLFRPVPRLVPAEPDDATALAALLSACWTPHRSRLGERAIRELSPDPGEVASWLRGGFEVYKAILDGQLVGTVRCAFPTGACLIDWLAVHPRHRRRGFGEYLAEHAISRARRAGAARAWTQVPVALDEANQLLRKLGFREAGDFFAAYFAERLLLLELPL
jgi:ribosomal protein S18 acetylase RimI-like enzyme